MATTKPVPLCTLIMPSGNRCGSPALRDQRFCYHHSGSHRLRTREELLGKRLERLGNKLDAMDISELLLFVHHKVESLQKTFNRFPEVRYTLTYTLDRIDELKSFESELRWFIHQVQQVPSPPQPSANAFNNLAATPPESKP
jgi:hypothetical protein